MWDWDTYLLYVIIVFISFILLRQYDIKSKRFWLVAGLMPSFFLMVLRGRGVGIDLVAYEEHISMVPYNSYSEILYFFSEPVSELIYWVSYKCDGLRTFIIITSTLHYIFLYYAFKGFHKRTVPISIFFLFYYASVVTRSFNIVLNCLAITCSLCAYVNLFDKERKSKLRYWLFSLIAIGIHNTAIINIPIFFLCKPIYSNFRRTLIIRLSLMVCVTIIASVVLLKFIDAFMDLTGDQYSKYESLEKFGWGLLLTRLPFVLFFIFNRKLMSINSHSMYIPFFLLLIFDMIFANVRYVYAEIERVSMYTNISSYVLINLLCYQLCKTKGSLFLMLFVFWGVFGSLTYWLYIYNIIGGDGQGVGLMPYYLW